MWPIPVLPAMLQLVVVNVNLGTPFRNCAVWEEVVSDPAVTE